MPSEHVTFDNQDGLRLAGRLETPDQTPLAFALFAHCFTCTKDINAASRIARGLTDRGIGVLRFDFAGLGDSEGEFHTTNFAGNVQDLLAACAWMRDHRDPIRILIGHSLGGAAVLSAASGVESVRAVATIGAPSTPSHVRALFASSLGEIQREGSAVVSIGGRSLRIGRTFIEDLETHQPEGVIRNLRRPLMIFHSPVDRVVGVENAAELYKWATHPKSFVSLDKADHMLTDRRDADFVAAMISTWCEHILDDR